jgi:putative alpha-1,2-mannosidase
VNEATLHLPNGKTFRVVADHLSAVNSYVQSVTLNGKPLQRMFLRHEELMPGGELHFVMSPKTKAKWSMQEVDVRYSMTPWRK